MLILALAGRFRPRRQPERGRRFSLRPVDYAPTSRSCHGARQQITDYRLLITLVAAEGCALCISPRRHRRGGHSPAAIICLSVSRSGPATRISPQPPAMVRSADDRWPSEVPPDCPHSRHPTGSFHTSLAPAATDPPPPFRAAHGGTPPPVPLQTETPLPRPPASQGSGNSWPNSACLKPRPSRAPARGSAREPDACRARPFEAILHAPFPQRKHIPNIVLTHDPSRSCHRQERQCLERMSPKTARMTRSSEGHLEVSCALKSSQRLHKEVVPSQELSIISMDTDVRSTGAVAPFCASVITRESV